MNLVKSIGPVFLLAALAVGCGEKEEAPKPLPVPKTTAAAPVAPEATPVAEPAGAGGYEPTAEERIPGIMLPADAVPTPVTPAAAPETPAPVPAAK